MSGPDIATRNATPRPTAELDLTACDREPIHIPGSIQPHGLLLVAELSSRTVIGGAGDIEGRLAADWLGMPLDTLLGIDLSAMAAVGTDNETPLGVVDGPEERFDATLHRGASQLFVELEPAEDTASAAIVLSRLDAIATTFERAPDLIALADRAARAFRALTGFDRVMIYRFLDDGAGVVLAEDRDPAMPPFLNHHFPAADIPKQARALYVRNRVRVIPDVTYVPAPLRPDDAGLAALDLSDVALRSVSPVHMEYLRNMGVGASASISIVQDGLLWGLVACHHGASRRLGFEARAICRALAGGLSRQIRAKEDAETYRERLRLRSAEDAAVARFDQDAPIGRFFRDSGDALRRMIDADGFAAVRGGEVTAAGICPDASDILALASRIAPLAVAETFATHALGERLTDFAYLAETIGGVLAVTESSESSTLLMWFRAEVPETVEWAGNPHKAVAHDPDAMLTPRTSFEAWRETVRGRSRRWTLGEIEAAGRLRRTLFELRQARRLRELNRELGATVADREALLQQKDYLLKEVNHRVQNSLQLVQAFLALQARAEPSIAGHLGEAQRRLSAVALVHRRLYQADQLEAIDLARYLDDLVVDTRSAMGPEWDGSVTLDLAPILISADRAINIGLILTELVINANKYAYGGRPGPIAISLEQYRNQLRLIVADQGAGKAEDGGRTGFGTRMMGAMVQRLGGTIERYDNQPGLRVIVTAPIEQE